MATKSNAKETQIDVIEIQRGTIDFCVLGTTPLICEAMSQKAKQQITLPDGKKNAAQKASTLKHNPLEEYRDSVYKVDGNSAPTRIVFPATAFKQALRGVAIDIPGAAKAQIGRLTYVHGTYIPIYGVPKLFMSIVRNSDMNRTPDTRTRAIIERWACKISITYTKPLLRSKVVASLFASAGMMRGVGGWRPEKGMGDFGQFHLVGPDDQDFLDIVQNGGLEAQDIALADPECFDVESQRLFDWVVPEAARRGFKIA